MKFIVGRAWPPLFIGSRVEAVISEEQLYPCGLKKNIYIYIHLYRGAEWGKMDWLSDPGRFTNTCNVQHLFYLKHNMH